MGDLRDLYQEVILDHSRKPRNYRAIEGADRVALGHNQRGENRHGAKDAKKTVEKR